MRFSNAAQELSRSEIAEAILAFIGLIVFAVIILSRVPECADPEGYADPDIVTHVKAVQ